MPPKPFLEILISTMNRVSLDFIDTMFPYHKIDDLNLLIINQTTQQKMLVSHKNNIRVVNSNEFGLSKSRNLALKNTIGEIVLIADDDIVYLPDFDETVYLAHKKYPNATLISFQFLNEYNALVKAYPKKNGYINTTKHYLTSFEISFKMSHINHHAIIFDERFGIGAYFQSAEEQVIRQQLLFNNLHIAFVAKSICIHKGASTGTNLSDHKNIKAMTAFKYLVYKNWTVFWLLKYVFFLARHGHVAFKDIFKTYLVGLQSINSIKKMENEVQN